MAVTSTTKRRSTPQRPDESRIQRLNAVADAHLEFTRASADTAGFNPEGRRADGDYGLHHVDLDANPAALDDFHRRASDIITSRT